MYEYAFCIQFGYQPAGALTSQTYSFNVYMFTDYISVQFF